MLAFWDEILPKIIENLEHGLLMLMFEVTSKQPLENSYCRTLDLGEETETKAVWPHLKVSVLAKTILQSTVKEWYFAVNPHFISCDQ